jgi:BlaI family transcriptional regulator, penicillinase repressor
MDVLFAEPRLSVNEINDRLDEPGSYASTRAALSRLVEKGHLQFVRDGARYLYEPTTDRKTAGHGAIRHVIDTFFSGSSVKAIDAMLAFSSEKLTEDDYEQLMALVEKKRKGTGE